MPKQIKRHCPNCRKHTLQKVKHEKGKGRNKTHPLSKFSKTRLQKRGIGIGIGMGNRGRYSRGAMNSWKRYNKKTSKKTDLRFTCEECKKTNVSADKGFRAKNLNIE